MLWDISIYFIVGVGYDFYLIFKLEVVFKEVKGFYCIVKSIYNMLF